MTTTTWVQQPHSRFGFSQLIERRHLPLDELVVQPPIQGVSPGLVRDPVTGLPSVDAMYMAVPGVVPREGRLESLAAVVIQIEHFPELVAAFGPAAGDVVCAGIADRVRTVIRRGDYLFCAAPGELVVLCPNVDDEVAAQIGVRLRHAATGPLEVPQAAIESPLAPPPSATQDMVPVGIQLLVGASSARLAEAPVPSLSRLVGRARTALAHPRLAGVDGVAVYDAEHQRRRDQGFVLAGQLLDAVELGQLRLVWQPIVPARRGEVWAEALVRWDHPELGLLTPDQFIPEAERTGLIAALDRWVMRTAVEQAVEWFAEPDAPGAISVNASPSELLDPDYPARVGALLAETGMEPSRLIIEITERNPVDLATAARAIDQLRALGVLVALDDLGTGDSSTERLRALHVDVVKIDRSYVQGDPADRRNLAIVKGMVATLQSLGTVTVAEGVETLSQLDTMTELGVDRIQGFLWSLPLPADDTAAWIAGHKAAVQRRRG